MVKKMVVGCDNAAVDLKNVLIEFLKSKNVEVENVGCDSADDPTYYPNVAEKVCDKIIESGHTKKGLLVCGTGIGMSIAANKHKGIRAAACSDTYSARLTKMHNNTNIICFGERVVGAGLACDITDAFLDAEFEGGKHQIRIDMISSFEENDQ